MNSPISISLIAALLKMKCPRCRKGNAFKDTNPYHLKHVGEMYAFCPVCNLNYCPEPGFYFGGAIVSYPLMVTFNLLVSTVFYSITRDIFNHIMPLMITLTIASISIAPVMFRYSRVIFLYFLVRYDKNSKQNNLKLQTPIVSTSL